MANHRVQFTLRQMFAVMTACALFFASLGSAIQAAAPSTIRAANLGAVRIFTITAVASWMLLAVLYWVALERPKSVLILHSFLPGYFGIALLLGFVQIGGGPILSDSGDFFVKRFELLSSLCFVSMILSLPLFVFCALCRTETNRTDTSSGENHAR